MTAGVPAAFDDHVENYDRVAESALGRELRRRVHQVLEPLITTSTTVIDLGCGTGIDLEWLADRARFVHGVDPSPAMIERARRRCGGRSNVTLTCGEIDDLGTVEPADLILADFGVVNCLGPLPAAGRRLAERIVSGGHLVAVTMPRICPAERVRAAATLNRELWRRRNGPTEDPAYPHLSVHYASAAELARSFTGFELVDAEALGLVLPPFEQRSWLERRPRLLGLLADLDRRTASLGHRLGWGDHHIAAFRRKPA